VKSFSRFPLFAALFCLVCPVLAWAAAPNPVFVLNSLDGNVSVIDPVTWKEVKRIPTGKEPHHLYMTPDEKSVIVANALSDSLTFIDPRVPPRCSARCAASWIPTTCGSRPT
jgi:YVTN family beta-propeller protein